MSSESGTDTARQAEALADKVHQAPTQGDRPQRGAALRNPFISFGKPTNILAGHEAAKMVAGVRHPDVNLKRKASASEASSSTGASGSSRKKTCLDIDGSNTAKAITFVPISPVADCPPLLSTPSDSSGIPRENSGFQVQTMLSRSSTDILAATQSLSNLSTASTEIIDLTEDQLGVLAKEDYSVSSTVRWQV